MTTKATRFCTSCRQTKINKGFIAARRKSGRIVGYRCAECQKGKPGKSPYFLRSTTPSNKTKGHYHYRHTLGDFEKEINDRE